MNSEEMHGQLVATQAAIRALILLHPYPAEARRDAASAIEQLIAKGLPRNLSDDWLAGVANAKKVLLPTDAQTFGLPPR